MATQSKQPWFLRVFPDLCAFGTGLGLAYFLEWQTTDLVWSLWLCSLVLGYLTILSVVAGGAYAGFQAIKRMDPRQGKRVAAVVGGILVGLFFLGFFSLHFCGFHAGHSVFLNHFFPIQGMPKDGFGSAFMNPPLLWVLAFRHLMRPYGLFLIPAVIAERQHVFLPLTRAVQAGRATRAANGPGTAYGKQGPPGGGGPLGGDGAAMFRPYLNVVRMHLLIFFFAFCQVMKVGSFAVYATVYAVYFFPWSTVKDLRVKAARKQVT